MQIDLPAKLIERAKRRVQAGIGKDEADVLNKGLDAMDWIDQERQAIQEGIDAYRAGDVREWGQYAAEFQAEQNITSEA